MAPVHEENPHSEFASAAAKGRLARRAFRLYHGGVNG